MIAVYDRLEKEYRDAVLEIDRLDFGLEPTTDQIAIAEKYPELFTVLVANGKVRGYSLIWPLGSAYDKMISGDLWEDQICATDINVTSPNGYWIASLAAHPDLSKEALNHILIGNLTGRVHGLQNVAATPVTRAGAHCLYLARFRETGVKVERDNVSASVFVK